MALSEEQPDWAYLPINIVDLIAKKLVPPLSQFVRFCSVCKPWNKAIMENRLLCCEVLESCKNFEGCRRQVPFLMIPTKDKSQEKRGLYNIIDKKTYDLELPVPYNRRCCGSSYGWIATLDCSLAIRLINPFTGGIINLPSVDNCPITEEDEYEFYVTKVIFSDDPQVNPDNFMILALFGAWNSIAIIRPGDKSWTYTTSNLEKIVKEDVIFHRGKIYAVDIRLGIISVDVVDNTNSLRTLANFEENMIIRAKQHGQLGVNIKTYIVESSDGEVLIVQRFYDTLDSDDDPSLTSIHHKTVNFKVFKVQRDTDDEAMLVEVKNIGDNALFLGDNCSMSVMASRFSGCRSASIYFTDDIIEFVHPYHAGGPHDMGIFSLETGCFERYYDLDPSHLDMPPSFFILPHPSILLKLN